jgi:hypothetical protein
MSLSGNLFKKLKTLAEASMYLMKCEFVRVLSVLKIIAFTFVSHIRYRNRNQ